MVDCRCLVAMAIIHVICLQLLSTTESVEAQQVQLLPSDFTARWPSAYSRELRNGKYMRFGRASGLPEQLLDENNPLEDLAAELRARSDPLEDNLYRNMVIRLARLFRAQQRGSSAKVWTASGEGEKES